MRLHDFCFLYRYILQLNIHLEACTFSFWMRDSTVGSIVKEVTACLWLVFQPLHMLIPITEHFWNFKKKGKWDLPNCIGSLDSKYIRLKCPSKSGTMSYKYTNFIFIVLQALTSPDYKFITVEIGAYGKQSNAGIFHFWQLSGLRA